MAVYKIHITKAGKDAALEVDDAQFSNEVFAAIFAEGLKTVLNSKMTKITGMKELSGEALAKLQADAMSIAEKNLAALISGTFKFPGVKAKKPESREVTNEAMRIARDEIRDTLRAHKITLSHVPAKDITAAAKALVESEGGNNKYITLAKEAVAKRAEAPSIGIDLAALGLHADPAKVAAAEAARAQRGNNLSAAQAGRTNRTVGKASRAKPTASASDVLAGLTGGTPSHSGHTAH